MSMWSMKVEPEGGEPWTLEKRTADTLKRWALAYSRGITGYPSIRFTIHLPDVRPWEQCTRRPGDGRARWHWIGRGTSRIQAAP